MASIAPVTTGRWAALPLLLPPVLSGLAVAGLMPIMAVMSRHFASTPGADTLVRMMMTVVGAVMIIGAPASAFLAERLGERKILIGSLLLFAIAGAAGGFVDDLHILLGSRVLLGLALSASGVTSMSLMTKLVPDARRNRWIGYVSVVGSAGSVIILPLAGLLGSIDWRLVFALHLIALPILLLVLAFTPQPPAEEHAEHGEHIAQPHSGFPARLVLLGLVCGAVSTTLAVYVPFHLAAVGETDPNRIGIPLTAGILTGSMAAFAFGWVRHYLSAAKVFVCAFSIIAMALTAVALSHGMETMAVFMLLNGMGTGMIAPNLSSTVAAGDPVRRARRLGFSRAGYFGAPLLAQLPLEPLTFAYGPAAALLAIAGFSALMALFFLTVGRRLGGA